MRPIFYILVLLFISCNDANDNLIIQEPSKVIYTDTVVFINNVCCSKLTSISSQLIESPCENYQPEVFFDPTNFDDFELFQNIQPGEELTIKFTLIDTCETPCTIVCNRPDGIPIIVLDAYY